MTLINVDGAGAMRWESGAEEVMDEQQRCASSCNALPCPVPIPRSTTSSSSKARGRNVRAGVESWEKKTKEEVDVELP